MTRSVSIAAAVTAAAVLTAAGCAGVPSFTATPPSASTPSSLPSKPEAPPTTDVPTTDTDSDDGTPTVEAQTDTPAPSSPPSGQRLDQPHTTAPGSFHGVAVTADVYPVRRTGATSTATVRFRAADGSARFRILDALNDHNPEVSDKGDFSPDGLRLIDPKGKKAYLPATIRDRECLCSPRENGYGDRYTDVTVSVTFAAPPAGLASIDVLVPGFGTVGDVPIR